MILLASLRARVMGPRPAVRIGVVVVVVLAAGLGLLGTQLLGGWVSTDDAFVELPMVRLAAQVPGRVAEVLVAEHQRVAQGQLLVRLDAREYEVALERTRSALAITHNRMAQAEAAAASTEAEHKAATVELWRAERELERVRSLRDQGTVSQSNLESAQAAYDAAVAHARALTLRARAERAMLADDAPVREAEAAVRQASLQLEHTRINAPFSGFAGRRNVEPGAVVAPGQPLLALVGESDAWVMANFKETQIDRIRIGARVDVTIDAFPGIHWRGHVDSFSPATGAKYALIAPEPAAGNFTKVVQRVPVKIVIDGRDDDEKPDPNRGPRLATGLSAEVAVAVD